MARVSVYFSAVACLVGSAHGFAADPPPAFDAADVHVNPRVMADPAMRGGVLHGGRYIVRTANMVELISSAYGVEADKVYGGPSWLELDLFDIVAKAPVNTSPETVKLMLKTLLADRFKLKVHMDNKPMPVYALTLGKGKPKLTESAGAADSRCQGKPQEIPPGAVPFTSITCHARSMEQLAHDLPLMTWGYFTNPIVDRTGLKGTWDFDLKWTGRVQLGIAGAEGINLFDAVDKQLGLKLELQKIPMPVLVVDSVIRKPIENPPGTAAILPPPLPTEFEVATIKPTMPGATNTRFRFDRSRLDAANFPLQKLILFAWDINADELLADAPKFVESARFDIAAKAPPPPPGTETDIEDMRLMVRSLLETRFNLKTHMEERPVNGNVLSAVKPKLQKADPSNRTKCKEGPGPDGKDPRNAHPELNRLLTCQNMTLGQFVDQLLTHASGYAHVNVLDSTGLTDAYDFTLNFSTADMIKRNRAAGQNAGAADGSATDPNGALSFQDVLSQQLGLKLEMKKRPMQVLVIDHIDEKPTDN